jgi:Fe-S-cluster-containing dehydrogenase component/formate-dependent nitrite reductase membrane component NrfD
LRYGFVIDHNRCIGCHACTVACKEENSVPLGVFRTWVKYIEKGQFPHTSRHFGVMRCNHCDDAPCVAICPTGALFRRDDGIVDFDNSRCIGCQSCMQACPYDALYLDPASHTAAKCNFCAHRIEMNLEPACVIVCPTQAISAGDIDNPESSVGRIIATQKVAARKPHKGTRPKLFYTGIEGDFLQPSMMEPQATHLFAERQPEDRSATNELQIGSTRSNPGAAKVVYDVGHRQPWGSIPAFYLWTKSMAAGVLMVAALLYAVLPLAHQSAGGRSLLTVMAPAAALLFSGITTLLLIADLHRPDRFYYILIKPNPRSWLVVGTWILILYSILAALWLACGVGFSGPIPVPIIAAGAIAGAAAAGYSAFLFAQAKGRDLWQSPLFLWHLLVQAVIAGAAVVTLLAVVGSYLHLAGADVSGWQIIKVCHLLLLCALVVGILMVLGELLLTPFSAEAGYAAAMILRGRLRNMFWGGVVLMGTVVPAVLLCYVLPKNSVSRPVEVLVALLSLAGLLLFEKIWIVAGQAPPLS